MPDLQDNIPENTPEGETQYLLDWMKKCREQIRDNPDAFSFREPGIYIGGWKLKPGDTIVKDNHGFPHFIRKGYCQ